MPPKTKAGEPSEDEARLLASLLTLLRRGSPGLLELLRIAKDVESEETQKALPAGRKGAGKLATACGCEVGSDKKAVTQQRTAGKGSGQSSVSGGSGWKEERSKTAEKTVGREESRFYRWIFFSSQLSLEVAAKEVWVLTSCSPHDCKTLLCLR